MFGESDNDTFHLGEAEEGDLDYVNGGTGTDTVHVIGGTSFRLDAATVSSLRTRIIADGFTAPSTYGIGLEMPMGDAFLTGIETIVAGAETNTVWISTSNDLTNSGLKTLDLTAGMDDVANFTVNGAIFTLEGVSGASRMYFSSTGPGILGVDIWNLTNSTDTVTVKATHASAGLVTLNASGYDVLKLTDFSIPLEVGNGLIEGTNLIANGFYRIETGAKDDVFHGSDGISYFHGGAGTNTFHASLGADTLISTGNLKIDYSASLAPLIFNGPSDRRGIGIVNDPLSLSAGDVLQTSGWSEIKGSIFADTLVVVGQYGTLISNGGNDRLHGRDKNDTLIGADGYAEYMNPGDGNDIIEFGTGGGELNYSSSTLAGVIDLEARTFVFGTQFDTVAGDFDKIVGTSKSDEIRGTENADIIDGGSNGYDVIYGRGGNDTITFTRGVVHGDDGADTITATSNSVIVFGGNHDDLITVKESSMVYGGEGDDTIVAGKGSTVYGEGGKDILRASTSDMVLIGGADGDTFTFGQYAVSTLSYATANTGVTLRQAGSQVHGFGGDAEGDVVHGRFDLQGSDHADDIRLTGYSYQSVDTGAGDDYVEFTAKEGITIHLGDGNDEIVLRRGQIAYGEAGDDIFRGVGKMHGGDGNDEFFLDLDYYLHSWAGSIVGTRIWAGGNVNGGSGNNIVHGGSGDDTVNMLEGANTFIINTVSRKDTIMNAGADDVIRLDGTLAFASLSDVAERLTQVNTHVMLDFGYMDDHEDVYGENAPRTYLGAIEFKNMTIDQVMALNWEFT